MTTTKRESKGKVVGPIHWDLYGFTYLGNKQYKPRKKRAKPSLPKLNFQLKKTP
jgi:hypothetical protein